MLDEALIDALKENEKLKAEIKKNNALINKFEKAKQHYEQVIDAILYGLCVVDKNYLILSYNKFFAKKVKLNIEKIKGLYFDPVISRYDNGFFKKNISGIKEIKSLMDNAFKKGLPVEKEYCNYDKYGIKRFYAIRAYPTFDKDKTGHVVLMITEITYRMRILEEVRWLNEFKQRILDAAPISIVVLDKKGMIISDNDMAKKLLDQPDKPAIGTKLIKTKEIAGNKKLLKLYQKLLANGEPFSYNNFSYISQFEKTKRFFNLIAVPLFNQNKIEGALSMAIDNTEIMKAKEELESLNTGLEKKVIERTRLLDITNKKLVRALDLKSKFISDASHELRTPLTVIQGNLDLAILERERKNAKIPESIPIILQEVHRINSILTDLTLLTNADQKAETIAYEKVDLNSLIGAVSQSLKVLAEQKRIKLYCKKSKGNFKIMGDEAKLEKLIINILRNAIRYTDANGKVYIWAEKEKAGIRIIIKDTGIGISEKDLPFIFERFYRVDKARSRNEGGTGIGLSIAKWLAEAHGGNISVKSKLGKGSIFTIYLPFDYKNI